MINHVERQWIAVSNWALLAGTWQLTPDSERYGGPNAPGGYGLALCKERFRDGFVRVSMRFDNQGMPSGESAGVVLGYNPETGAYLVAGLGAFDQLYAIWEFIPGSAWVLRRGDRKSTRLNSSHRSLSRMPSSA